MRKGNLDSQPSRVALLTSVRMTPKEIESNASVLIIAGSETSMFLFLYFLTNKF
jgi:hypothetical protein